MDGNFSHLASIYGNDFLELVWEKGEILVQGGSSNRTRKTPLYAGDPINPSRKEELATDEDASITKRTRSSSLHSLLDRFPAQRDSDLSTSHQRNGQDSCQIDLQSSQSKSSCKLNEEFANLTPVKDSKLTGGRHQPVTTDNSHLCTYSSGQCLPSDLLKKPRTDSSQTPATNSQKQYLGCDQRIGKVNFSNFLIPSSVLLKSIYQGNSATKPTSVEEIEAGKVEKAEAASTSSKALDNSILIESAKGSHGLTGFQEQTSLTAKKWNPASLVERSVEPPVDQHSEVACHNSALNIHGSHGQCYNRNSSSAALRSKGKGNINLCREPFLASSSGCSLEASNDPNFGSRKHEATDCSTYLGDNEEEPEDMVKEMPAWEGNRVKRSRNAEIHNLSERKRRDRINKKMRTLQELIPNCNKVDKTSLLDDAIDYLKTLKLQLQIMSMGSGFCMPLMMLPAAANHINASHLPQLMGAGGLGFRPGTGIPCSPLQFPIPPQSGITDKSGIQMFGFSNQFPPMPNPHAPFIRAIGKSSTQPLMPTSTATNLAEHLANSAQLTTPEVSVPKNSGLNAKAECATKQAPTQFSLPHSTSHPFLFPSTNAE